MIEFTVGVPGSGKTYRALYALYSNFGLNEKLRDPKFKHNDINFAYTNINEIKIDHFEKDTVKNLDWDLFKDNLTTLHDLYKNKATDKELIVEAKELNMFECLVVLDECHNYLDTQDKVLIWWLSYHRHIHHQVYLITQNLSLVYSKYKSFSEFFYQAKPSSLKLFKNKMVYNQYTNSRLSQVSKSGVAKLPFVKEIYDSYHSGANQQSENLLKKFALLAVFFLGFLVFMILAIQQYMTKDIETKEDPKPINKIIDSNLVNAQFNHVEETRKIEDIDNLKLFKFNCMNNMCYHTFQDLTSIKIPTNILKSFLTDIDKNRKFIELKSKRLYIYVLENEDRFKFLDKSKQGVNNENDKSYSDVLNFNK